MDFVNLRRPTPEEDEEEKAEEEDVEVEMVSIEKAPKSRTKRRKTTGDDAVEDEDTYVDESEKRKKRRRKTLGDEDEAAPKSAKSAKSKKDKRRRTMGDEPSSSKFHTQTLTQMPSWSPQRDIEVEVEEEKNLAVFDTPDRSSQVLVAHRRNPSRASKTNSPAIDFSTELPRALGSMGPPQTPHRKRLYEIPSSESPASPLSVHSRSSPTKHTPSRTPLRECSPNVSIPFAIGPKSSPPVLPGPPILKIADTYDTEESEHSRIPSTPSKRSSPTKSVRFAADIPANKDEEEEDLIPSSSGLDSLGPIQSSATSRRLVYVDSDLEIQDSEAESELEEEEEETREVGKGLQEKSNDSEESKKMEDEDGEAEQETCYGHMGLDTQYEVYEEVIPSLEHGHREASQELGEETQKSTYMESQRISTQHVKSMLATAPPGSNSDVFISVKPSQVEAILDRKKDHEFRSKAFPDTVRRIWLYETAPRSTLTYMAAIGPQKRPGAELSQYGLGNTAFNAHSSKSGEYAYEILGFYELANPLTLRELKSREWLKAPPQAWQTVKPAVLGELIANLLPPIFDETTPIEDTPTSSSTDTQDASAQLFSTIVQFTQPATIHTVLPSSSQVVPATKLVGAEDDEDHPASPPHEPESHTFPRPSQAETVDLTQTQCHTPRQTLPEIIWESPVRPAASSGSPELPSPGFQAQDSLVPFSIPSSQLLTKSQMLPAYLLNDSVPGPPPFVQDSQDELEED